MQFFVRDYSPPPLPQEVVGRRLAPMQVYDILRKYHGDSQTALVNHLRDVKNLINSGTQGFGPDIAAATDITVSAYQHRVVSSGTIQNILTAPGLPASHVTFIADASFVLALGGNISFPKNIRVNQAVMLVWSPVTQKWYPIVSIADLGDVPDDPGNLRFTVSAVDVNHRALIDFTQPGHIGEVLPQLYDYTTQWQAVFAYTFSTYITDSNGNIQQLITEGISGAAPPVWSVVLDGLTPDGTAVWENVGGSGAASIILRSAKYLQVQTHQATPAEIQFATAGGVAVSKFTKGATAATDLSLIPVTNGVGTVALGDTNVWAAVQLKATAIHILSANINLTGANVNLSGKVAKYNNITTVKNGVPAEYGKTDLPGQVAAIGATTLYAVPADGLYRVTYAAKITTVASVSSVLGGANGFQVVYTDADDAVVVTTGVGPINNLNTTQSQVNGVVIVNAKAGSNLQFSFGYTSVGTAMAYALHAIVEAL